MNRDQIFLRHVLDEIEFLEEYFPENSDKELLNDPAVQRFTVRSPAKTCFRGAENLQFSSA